jgi:hypothetical protein
MPCMSRSGLARLDPLISPGTTSQHVHAIHGSSGESPFCPLSAPRLPRIHPPQQALGLLRSFFCQIDLYRLLGI